MAKPGITAVVVALIACGVPGAAHASRATYGGSPLPSVRVAANPGETNDVTITVPNSETYYIRDSAGIVAGNGCTQRAPTEVACPASGVEITLLDGADRADAGHTSAVIDGGDGNDVLATGNGHLSGGAGDDQLFSRSSPTFPELAFRLRTVTYTLSGGDGADKIVGGEADERLVGGAGGDDVNGGGGHDVLDESDDRAEQDALNGGDGSDWLEYTGRDDGVAVDLSSGTAGELGEGDAIGGIENVSGGAGSDVLVGDDGANLFLAHRGADQVVGRGGGDTAFARTDGDAYDLGSGDDEVDYSSFELAPGSTLPPRVEVDLEAGTGEGSFGTDRLTSVENATGTEGDDVLLGSDHDNRLDGSVGSDVMEGRGGADHLVADRRNFFGGSDQLSGGDGDDVLRAGPEQDRLEGGDGDDVLVGDSGHDVVDGGFGTDLMAGGGGFDTVTYAARADMVVVSANGEAESGASHCNGCENDTIVPDFERLIGSQVNDRLIGNDQPNELIGGPGDDVLQGNGADDGLYAGDGRDLLLGGLGSDNLDGGPGADTVYGNAGPIPIVDESPADPDDPGLDIADYADRSAPITIRPARDRLLGGETGEGDVLVGVDGVRAGSANDVIEGSARPETFDGGPGDDRLEGARGNDALLGGDGADLLIAGAGRNFLAGDAGSDRVRARNRRTDRIACGPGSDRGIADRRDRLRDCEAVSLPRQRRR